MPRPDLSRVPEYFHRYIGHVKENDLAEAISNQTKRFVSLLESIPVEKRDYKYAEDKWTTKEVLQHIIDTERIFAYRALRIARKDSTPLPGFDENQFANNSNASSRNWDDLIEEFKVVRRSSEILLKSFNNDQMEASGTAGGKSVYVLAIGFMIPGHAAHHENIIKERYLA